ncbi:hypothetical protein JMUB5695_00146 [Mycobacterium heckeshornense]|uniref:hypothetical protein n=1 Tax=Mycobacterium heckeshornense TaxID=110505 RepID=UPI001AF68E78|nr:hypothetical protein [Mycobacterium heckeshornense]BCQ06737.1 hypothetical protein JMUB5695_00146 [Mycobacterium heckeshornense]
MAEFAAKVHVLTGTSDTDYNIRQAGYDLRKLRGKRLIDKPDLAQFSVQAAC